MNLQTKGTTIIYKRETPIFPESFTLLIKSVTKHLQLPRNNTPKFSTAEFVDEFVDIFVGSPGADRTFREHRGSKTSTENTAGISAELHLIKACVQFLTDDHGKTPKGG